MIRVAFRSPYDPKVFVRIEVPHTLSLQELRQAGDLSAKALAAARGEGLFDRYPLCAAGALGLMILSKCCPASDEAVVTGLLGGYSFAKQAKSKLESRELNEELMADAIEQFKVKYGPHFVRFAVQRLGAEHAPWVPRIIELLGKTTA
jgi:hypothetical protein